jgi:transcriptional regulator with XRE-family HTH domain
MPGRPKPKRKTGGVARLLSEVVADNLRAYRVLRRLSQETVAERMRRLGHEQWSRPAVSEVERGGRSVDVDELLSLAVVLEKSVSDLLDPTGPGSEGRPRRVDYGGTLTLDAEEVSSLVRGGGVEKVAWPEKGAPKMTIVDASRSVAGGVR